MTDEPATITIPDPCLVVLVGAAGSGKSSFAARHFPAEEILSSDAFRERIAGDPGDQRATRAAFGALHRALRRRLAAGRSAVVDATNVTAGARAALLRLAHAAGIPAVAVVLDLPPELVMARNAARPGSRAVPAEAVAAQLAQLRRAVDGGALAGDGFVAVRVLTGREAVDQARIERTGRVAG